MYTLHLVVFFLNKLPHQLLPVHYRKCPELRLYDVVLQLQIRGEERAGLTLDVFLTPSPMADVESQSHGQKDLKTASFPGSASLMKHVHSIPHLMHLTNCTLH